MRSTIEKMSSAELIEAVNRLDEQLNDAMIEGKASDESMNIFQAMSMVIEELEIRHIQGWWSRFSHSDN